MECEELHRDELAEKYLNGQLDPAMQDGFEVHILGCAQCLRRVEAIQTLRQELAQHAPQIRAYSQVERSRLRWHWVTVAAFGLLVCGLGVVEFRRMKAPQSAKLPPPVPASSTSATGPNGAARTADSSQASSTKIDNLPVNGRNYIDFTKTESRVSRGNAPPLGPAPSAGLNLRGQRARSDLAPVDAADATDNSVSGDRSSAPPPAVASSPTPSISPKPQPAEVASDENAKELFRLGTVQAPPYTFSGFASSGKDTSAGANPSALSGRSGSHSSDSTRPYFRNAMNAYVERRYADALKLLEQAIQIEPKASYVNFYLGICRLLEAKPGDSIAPFNAVLRNQESQFTQAAHFYLAKAFIQTGSLAQAEEQLQSAAAMPGSLSTEAGLELARLQALHVPEGKAKNTEDPHR